MADTPLQIAKFNVSEQRVRVMQQETRLAHMRRDGGPLFEHATADLHVLREELERLEAALAVLVFQS